MSDQHCNQSVVNETRGSNSGDTVGLEFYPPDPICFPGSRPWTSEPEAAPASLSSAAVSFLRSIQRG